MKKSLLKLCVCISIACVAKTGCTLAQSINVFADKPVNGTFKLEPALPADGKYPAGTVVTITAKPDPGYVVDAVYYSDKGRWGQMYFESMTPTWKVIVDHEKHLGASFIEESAVAHINVTQNEGQN
jgi:hypothetical protein